MSSSDVERTSDRRGFVRKLLGLAAAGGLASLLLGERVEKAYAGSVFSRTGNTANGTDSVIAGGASNTTYDNYNFIGGGQNNKAGTNDLDTTTQIYATVGGGTTNTASASWSTVGGGSMNTASGNDATVAGGRNNIASGYDGTVGGGNNNRATGIAGTSCGGDNNLASGDESTIGGGSQNTTSGGCATVPGGAGNLAAGYFSLAAGRRAKVNAAHDGAFLWGDETNLDFNSAAANEFAARATGGVRFVTGVDGSGNPLASRTLVYTPGGFVGVGTNTPTAALHIVAAIPIFRFTGTSLPGNQWHFGRFDQSNRFTIAETGVQDWLTILGGSGNVGIGNISPAFKLDVNGACHATSFPTSSDMRFKEDIAPLTNVLERLEQVRGVTFEWNRLYESLGRSTAGRQIGLIAQEVEQAFPELVCKWAQNGVQDYRGVDYGRFTAVLVEAVKELRNQKNREIDELREQNRALQARIERVEQSIPTEAN